MLTSEVNVILQYPHQINNFLEAKIITSPENSTNHLLDPTQDAVVSGSLIQLRIFNSFTPFDLILWIIPKYICPLVSFTLPNDDDFSLTITSSKLADSFCVFTNDYQREHIYYYGSNSNSTISRFELYSKKVSYLHDVCYDYYCKTQISGSIFFWFRTTEIVSMKSFIQVQSLRSLSSSSNSINTSNITQKKINTIKNPSKYKLHNKNHLKTQSKLNFRGHLLDQSDLTPLPYYNSTSKYNVGKDFDIKMISTNSCPIESRKNITFIATMIAVGITVVFLLLQIIDGIVILWKSRRANGRNSNGRTTALPITLVLNHYCPNTSAKIVMPEY